MHGLNRLLSKPSQLQVLRILHHADKPLTGRETERRSTLSNRATMLALESLVETAAVHYEQVGNAYHYSINKGHYLVAKVLARAFEAEDLFWDDMRKTVRKTVAPRPIAVVATGALARDERITEGRVDLIMLFPTGRNRLRAFRTMETLSEVIWNRYGITLGYNLLDMNTMDDQDNDALWRRVEREGILLFGTLP
jgi:hypothetical protein